MEHDSTAVLCCVLQAPKLKLKQKQKTENIRDDRSIGHQLTAVIDARHGTLSHFYKCTWRGSTGLPWSDITSDDIMSVVYDIIISEDGIIISVDETGRPPEDAAPALTPFLLLAAADTLAVLLLLLLLLLLLAVLVL